MAGAFLTGFFPTARVAKGAKAEAEANKQARATIATFFILIESPIVLMATAVMANFGIPLRRELKANLSY